MLTTLLAAAALALAPSPAAPALPNLTVVGITHTYYVYPDNTCSVVLRVRVRNSGAATSNGFVVGAKGWGTASISSCTGTWRAINTTASLGASQERTITVYGPGYVGPRILRGSALTVTARADTHCAIVESSESDNALTRTIHVGS